MRYKIFALIMMTTVAFNLKAQRLSVEKSSYTNEWEYAAECVKRICPAGMWDKWSLKDIHFDKDDDTMYLLVQMGHLKSQEDPGQEEMKDLFEYTLENIIIGYKDALSNKSINIDGDWMLYLTVGNLLQKLAENKVNVKIIFEKPIKYNILKHDKNIFITPEELQKTFEKIENKN